MQLCTLLSVKDGRMQRRLCLTVPRAPATIPAWCVEKLMTAEEVLPHAPLRQGEWPSTRFCMGAAWKGSADGDQKLRSCSRLSAK